MKKNISVVFISCLLVTFGRPVFGQETILSCTDSVFCVPGVMGVPRTKGLVIKREATLNYGIKSRAIDPIGNANAEIKSNSRWQFKLRAPVLLKKSFKIAVGFEYFTEEFRFENPDNIDYSFYNNLEDRNLNSMKGEIFFVKSTLTNKYFLLRISIGLNGDYDLSENFGKKEFLRYSFAPLFGWKQNKYLSYAVGLAYSYNFGNRSIFPLFSYNHTFNHRWGIESILPVKLKLRYNSLSEKNYYYLKSELNGANYGIHLADVNQDLTYLNKSEVRVMLVWEREIHDWLWFGVEAGYRKNIDYDVSDSYDFDVDRIINNNLNDSFIWNFSIFLVPPRKFLE